MQTPIGQIFNFYSKEKFIYLSNTATCSRFLKRNCFKIKYSVRDAFVAREEQCHFYTLKTCGGEIIKNCFRLLSDFCHKFAFKKFYSKHAKNVGEKV